MTGWGVLRGVGVSQKGGEGTPYDGTESGHLAAARLLRPPPVGVPRARGLRGPGSFARAGRRRFRGRAP